jgi:antitoxin component of RelBE/YafQ-DinJ toxin-antitoxin module
MITMFECYFKDFKHVADLLDQEGMTPTEIARIFLTYVSRKEALCQSR